MAEAARTILTINKGNEQTNLDKLATLSKEFENIDSTDIQDIAEAMASLALSAETLNKINWESIVFGINSINSINTSKSDLNSPNSTSENENLNTNSIDKKINLDLKLSGDTNAQELIQKEDTPIERTVQLNVTDENINNILSKFTIGINGNDVPSDNVNNAESSSVTIPSIDSTGI